MEKVKLSFQHEEGKVDGIYVNPGANSPLVIIINGHNGFYNYGMFPYIQEQLYLNGIASYSFNFSHGGIQGDGDYFEDLHLYEQNCMRLETEDVLSILTGDFIAKHPKIVLFAHSLGGVPAIFGAKHAIEEHLKVDGIILVSTVKTLRFWPATDLKVWAAAGVLYKRNNRTGQELPQGFELLQEVMASDTKWNVQQSIISLRLPILIIHGANDEAVSVDHGRSLFEWIKDSNKNTSLEIIPNATHTYNTKHPFYGPTEEVNALINVATQWINHL
ncbi:MAG: alpha/beta fold hydrolase [Ginsengibacter sp.]